jgi:hypothetical protein
VSSPITRRRLFAENPHCRWCNKLTVLHGYGKPKGMLATVDHVKSKEQVACWEEYVSPANKVLACYDCNQARNDALRAVIKRGPNPPPALRPPPGFREETLQS